MRRFEDIQKLCLFALQSDENEWIYVNRDRWRNSPKECTFWCITEEEVENLPDDEVYETEDGPFLPISIRSEHLYPWMLIDTIRGILSNLKIESPTAEDVELIIRGMNHYLEMDDFMDVP